MWYIYTGLLLYITCMIHFKSKHKEVLPLAMYFKGFLLFTFLWPISFPFYLIVNYFEYHE